MTALKRIVTAAYETTDGQTFANKGDAAKHQAHLNRLKQISEMVAGSFQHSSDDMKYLDAVTVAEVALFIVENADELREILPKRAKAAPEKLPQTPEPAPIQEGVQVGSPLGAIGAVGDPQEPVAAGVTATERGHAHKTVAQPAFSFPAGLVNNVSNQQANANA